MRLGQVAGTGVWQQHAGLGVDSSPEVLAEPILRVRRVGDEQREDARVSGDDRRHQEQQPAGRTPSFTTQAIPPLGGAALRNISPPIHATHRVMIVGKMMVAILVSGTDSPM